MGMLKLEVEMPPMLVGLNEAQIQKIMSEKLDQLLREFTTKSEKLYLGNGYDSG